MAEPRPPDVESLLDFRDRVVMVTGAGTGLGRGIAIRFAEAGADLGIHYSRSESGARQTRADVAALGRRAAVVRADVTDPDDVDRLIDATLAEFGRLDVLINCAGIYPVIPLLELKASDWEATMSVNLRGAFLCTQAAARKMPDGGSITNITSVSAHYAVPGHAHYCASKAGLEMLTQVSAAELAGQGIRVNAVAPGLIWRDGLDDDWPEGVARWEASVPLRRLGYPADVADACLFLASPAARWITGASLRVDGGIMTNQVF
jgi:NAD(P)-dependent dehydrogenase (short-subunit alcohol dehydrogenase family)